MNWADIRDAVSYFIYGAAVGYFWHPIWNIIKKIIHEATVAKNEWRQPPK